ncbi:unnamed protein product [Protopolystoma xenopodis]|uniref:Uncharacterized protein n=1 Tax=Protopolystoma xenopodis TaxID=117903 RepID=A0A3S5CJK3_9PLAT|nr:unnamed protein product [Protopolystoma xenopodis]
MAYLDLLLAIFRLTQESLLIFHEDFATPVYRVSAARLSRSQLDAGLSEYSLLAVPRLSSPARLLDLCPTDGHVPPSLSSQGSKHRHHYQHKTDSNSGLGSRTDPHLGHRHLCLVLLLSSSSSASFLTSSPMGLSPSADLQLAGLRMAIGGNKWFHAVDRLIQSSTGTSARHRIDPVIVPVHIYMDRQAAWLRQLAHRSVAPVLGRNAPDDLFLRTENAGHLLWVWRMTSNTTAFRLIPLNSQAHPARHAALNSDLGPPTPHSSTISCLFAHIVTLLVHFSGLIRSILIFIVGKLFTFGSQPATATGEEHSSHNHVAIRDAARQIRVGLLDDLASQVLPNLALLLDWRDWLEAEDPKPNICSQTMTTGACARQARSTGSSSSDALVLEKLAQAGWLITRRFFSEDLMVDEMAMPLWWRVKRKLFAWVMSAYIWLAK